MERAVRKHTYEVIGFEDFIKSVKKINVNKIVKEVWKENEKRKRLRHIKGTFNFYYENEN